MLAPSGKISVPAAFVLMVFLILIISWSGTRRTPPAKPKTNDGYSTTTTYDSTGSETENEAPANGADPYSELRSGKANRHWVP